MALMMKLDLDDLKYGNLTRGQREHMANPTPLFDLSFEDLPLIDPPRNSSREVLKEFHTLRISGSLDLIPEEDMIRMDDDFVKVFEDHLKRAGLPIPEWVREYSSQMGVFILKIKDYFQRPRPRQLAAHLKLNFEPHRTATGHSPSYPSGHAAQAIALALALENLYGNEYGILRLGKAISYSRLQMGVHFPSDKAYGEMLGEIFYRKCLLF